MMKISNTGELNAFLLDALASNSTFQQILGDICEKTEMQIALLDLSNRLLMHAFGKSESRIWDFALEKGYLPQSITAKGSRTGESIDEMFRTDGLLVFDAGEIDDCFHLCRPLFAYGKPEGILVVRFSDKRYEALAGEIAKKLTILCDYFKPPKTSTTKYEGNFFSIGFTRELLLYDGDISRNIFWEAYKIHAGLLPGGAVSHFIPYYSIAVMCELNTSETKSELRKAETALSKYIPQSFHLISGNNLLALIFGLEDSPFSNDRGIITQLERFASNYHLYCSISSKFSDLSQRKYFKLQALEALKLGSRKNPSGFVFIADEMYSEILLSASVGRVGKQMLILSYIEKLSYYDRENDTNYLNTLEQYLKHSNRLSTAAGSMFIDRSTLKYRLQKIKGILQKDFDLPSNAKLLRTAIAVYRSCEK